MKAHHVQTTFDLMDFQLSGIRGKSAIIQKKKLIHISTRKRKRMKKTYIVHLYQKNISTCTCIPHILQPRSLSICEALFWWAQFSWAWPSDTEWPEKSTCVLFRGTRWKRPTNSPYLFEIHYMTLFKCLYTYILWLTLIYVDTCFSYILIYFDIEIYVLYYITD